MEPGYLKDLVKLIRVPLGKSKSSGVVAFEESSFACFKVGGKFMASDFDRRVFDPVCIMRPKQAKCLMIRGVAVLDLQWSQRGRSYHQCRRFCLD
jgi:hypothetical protein